MTLVKLDSGDYINPDAVDSIKSGDDPYLVMRCGDVISITPADRDRIVEAMNGKPYKPMTRQLKRALNSAAGGR